MSTRNKIIFGIALVLVVVVLFMTKCSTKVSYTYSVETGDKIKISFTTGNGYMISDSSPFEITKNGQTLSQGVFISLEGYEQFVEANAEWMNNAKVIENKKKGDNEYTLYNYNDSEWDYVIKIGNSKTGLFLSNSVSEKSARECFNRLTIEEK